MSEAVSLSMSLAAIAISTASVLLMRRTARTEARTQKLIDAREAGALWVKLMDGEPEAEVGA